MPAALHNPLHRPQISTTISGLALICGAQKVRCFQINLASSTNSRPKDSAMQHISFDDGILPDSSYISVVEPCDSETRRLIPDGAIKNWLSIYLCCLGGVRGPRQSSTCCTLSIASLSIQRQLPTSALSLLLQLRYSGRTPLHLSHCLLRSLPVTIGAYSQWLQ